MSEFAYLNARFVVNAVDLSDHLRSSQLNGSGDTLDKTAMGQAARTFLMGLRNWSASVEFNDDMAASNVDATLWAAHVGGVAIPVSWRPENDTISATNPDFQWDTLVNEYNVGGSVGALATKSLTWQADGDVVRDTTP